MFFRSFLACPTLAVLSGGFVRLREDRPQFLALFGGVLRRDVLSRSGLDDCRQPEDTLVRFVDGHTQLCDEFAVRSAASRRPIVPGHTHPGSEQLLSDFALDPVDRQLSAERDDAEAVAQSTWRSSSAISLMPWHQCELDATAELSVGLRFNSPSHQARQLTNCRYFTPASLSAFAPSLSCAGRDGIVGQAVLVDAVALRCFRSARRTAGRLRWRLCGCPDRRAALRASASCRSPSKG